MGCSHNCDSCSAGCGGEKSLKVAANAAATVRKVIGVVSGTGDVPLTVFQSLPVDGILVVTSPQDLVSMIVTKAVKMAEMMNIPVIGVVENYSYLECPDCGRHISVFGESHIDDIAAQHGLNVLAKLPIDPKLAEAVDAGKIEDIKLPDALAGAMQAVEALR